jgi:cytidyltransferase-like protein
MNKQIVLVTGGFDPLHSGHIAYFNEAKKLGNYLIVGVNSDTWLTRKKGRPFMAWNERAEIIKNLSMVNEVIEFDDSNGSANDAIYKVLQRNPDTKIIFANGGDRTPDNIPEYIYKNTPWVHFEFGVGGEDKKNSSSWILDEWKTQKTDRQWGYWRVLDDKGTIKTKELVINPGCSLSNQRHFKRSEHWYVLQGSIKIETEYNNRRQTQLLSQHNTFVIGPTVWHKTTNIGDTPAHIIEIQYGEACVEEDIERRD